VYFFNGKSHTYGKVEASKKSSYASFEFKLGEYIINDVVISGNGKGTRTGYINFETNLGNTFEAGSSAGSK